MQRLRVDHIDLLQFHWPERNVPLFGQPVYYYELERAKASVVPILEQLEAVDELIKEGKIKHFGLSNETPYGGKADKINGRHMLLRPFYTFLLLILHFSFSAATLNHLVFFTNERSGELYSYCSGLWFVQALHCTERLQPA